MGVVKNILRKIVDQGVVVFGKLNEESRVPNRLSTVCYSVMVLVHTSTRHNNRVAETGIPVLNN
jgi:hypothetical protein